MLSVKEKLGILLILAKKNLVWRKSVPMNLPLPLSLDYNLSTIMYL